MFPERFRLRPTRPVLDSVVIADHDHNTRTEGVIEGVRQAGGRVDVRMLLSDGGCGIARVDRLEWDWLELRVGDIVAVMRSKPSCCAGQPTGPR